MATVSDADIRAFIQANAAHPNVIYNGMLQYNVTFDDIMRAGNWTFADVQNYVAQSNDQGLRNAFARWVAQRGGGSTAATSNQVAKPTDAEIVAYINANLNNPAAIYQGMVQYGVTFPHIARAGSWTVEQIADYVYKSNYGNLINYFNSWHQSTYGQPYVAGSVPAVAVASGTAQPVVVNLPNAPFTAGNVTPQNSGAIYYAPNVPAAGVPTAAAFPDVFATGSGGSAGGADYPQQTSQPPSTSFSPVVIAILAALAFAG